MWSWRGGRLRIECNAVRKGAAEKPSPFMGEGGARPRSGWEDGGTRSGPNPTRPRYPSNPSDGPGVASFGSTDSAGLAAAASNAANIR